MIEALCRRLDPTWTTHVEVPVIRPARGVIDLVLERRCEGLLVAAEAYSELRRLEQQLRWSADKALSLGSSTLVGPGPMADISRLLILRSTESTRALARQFEATFRAAYPARASDAVGALIDGRAWPGPGVVWIRIDGDDVRLLDGPPRGVSLGR